ncbi:CynX/NimT family MFS transporter [Marinobacter caseinilyticus]|uniref:MFS transporter n=1 Tax=Marinobacter caseinilyticus TaxID=2692195 RepID=UPI001F4925C3|nr:MFS transporter [Marinobacter caseinilyticus]
MSNSTPAQPQTTSLLLVALLLWLTGLYLRIPMLVAPALAPYVADELALTQALTGALTTLPVLMLAIGAMPGSLAISRIGPRNTLALALVIVAVGSASRGLAPNTVVLMLTSTVMGLGIAMMQPALPALLTRWLQPQHLALGTAVYMNGMLMGEFIGAGITLPIVMPLLENSWRMTLLAWSLPALIVAALLFLPIRELNRPLNRPEWLPDWSNPLTLRLGLLLGSSGSLFFGVNAYMGNLLAQRSELGRLDDGLFWFNFAQVAASMVMLRMARRWVGRKAMIVFMSVASLTALLGVILTSGWLSIALAVSMSFTAGMMLILLVALPPLLVASKDTGRLSAGNFTVGYTLSFGIPMVGGLVADAAGDTRYALATMLLYGVLVLPIAWTLNIRRPPDTPTATSNQASTQPADIPEG